MARPRSPEHGAQRERILAAAARLFAERGYAGATMNDVAAACGVSKGLLYHYVEDKHDLLHQIATHHVERLQALLPPASEPRTSPDEARLQALIQRFMLAYADAAAEHRVLTEDTRYLAPAQRAAVVQGQRVLVQAFADAVAAAQPNLDHTLRTPLAMLLLGMMNWTFTWLRPGGEHSHASLAPVVSRLFLSGLGGLGPLQPVAVQAEVKPVPNPAAKPAMGPAVKSAAVSAAKSSAAKQR